MKKIFILLCLLVLLVLAFVVNSNISEATCCYKSDGSFDRDAWCKEAGYGLGSICCSDGGNFGCKAPCSASYCEKDKCVSTGKFCSPPYSPVHAHGCDWVVLGVKNSLVYPHGVPTVNINNPAIFWAWKAAGCPHAHNSWGTTASDKCFNLMMSYPQAHGSNSCATDADCQTTTTTKGSTVCKTGETNPYYTCDNVNTYDYKTKSYIGIYCVKKDWCGVTNCDTKYNKKVTGPMFIEGVWFKDAEWYSNSTCKVCPAGQKNPHTQCSVKTETYKDGRASTLSKYTYDTCEKVNTCGVDSCDYAKNVAKGLGAYESCGETSGCHTAYEKTVYESAECKVTTTTSTSTTTTSKPSDPGNRYVCNPNSIVVDGYSQCILDNANKYPNAKSCDTKNNKFKVVPTECKLKSQSNLTCYTTVTYNTDCSSLKPTSTTKSDPKIQNACRISSFGFYYKNENRWSEALSLFSKPDKGILDSPKLEYIAEECNTCELTIEPSIPNFISKNPNIFGKLIGELIKGFSNRYVFERSYFNGESIILDVNELTPGSYTLTLDCTDPVLKEHQIKSIKLNIFPQLRWREVVPVIN